jgi:hypothetical protein
VGTVTVDLKAAGLTHAPGKSDKCGGMHMVHGEAIADFEAPGLVDAYGPEKALQALHEQAHPGGPAYWENCRDPACADAWAVLYTN